MVRMSALKRITDSSRRLRQVRKGPTSGHSITSSAVASSSGGTDLNRKVSRQPTPEELETGAYFADFDEYRSANGLTEERNVA
jgi:hypothetical protein